ncbi:hypothetical protein [Flavobacterium sp. KACC 22761]|uniref:hypothetical protein n=1 Tax=Flavobacterium sp. KACC 22761 TaxID=3092665 RepID=UPI002A757488|nr:hypothetical protein [Flavobacterium sp. KACC 22761]WPO76859.1 hypothetical protein SCB73_11300 [Flavobacterium sp. KACC 22761]
MKKMLLALSVFLSFLGCQNKAENQTKAEQPTETKEEIGAAPTSNEDDFFYIKLNTIYGENGLEDYAKDASEVSGKIIKRLNGADGSEYYLVKLHQTLEYRELNQKPLLKTDYLIVGGRFQEQPLQPGANKTVVNVAIVKDQTLINDSELDFNKAIFAGYGEATEIKI